MDTQIIIVLCEGPHDVAFICRILKSQGFASNEKLKIAEFPQPMANLMAGEIKQTEVRELNLQQIRKNTLPTNTLQKDNHYIFLYSMGGDGQKEARNRILKRLRKSIPEPGEIMAGEVTQANTQLAVVYFLDADKIGIPARLFQVTAEITEVITSIPKNAFPANGSYGIYERIKLGSYIFTGIDNETGKLEDVLIPLMQSGNEPIFNNASAYIENHYDEERTFPLKLSFKDNKLIETRSTKNKAKDFDKQKSIIGIAGQLQRSGKPNTAYISDTDYLTLDKINDSTKCQEIIVFFNKFMNNL